MIDQRIEFTVRRRLCVLVCLLPLMSCVAAQPLNGAVKTPRLPEKKYWQAHGKDNGRFYILPRPTLSPDFPTPEDINNLTAEQATTMTTKLNSTLQFRVQEERDNGNTLIRISPEPHLEDVIAICRQYPNQESIRARCQKELAWASKGLRPDIYLQLETCEAEFFAFELNQIYQRPQPTFTLCERK